MEQRADWQVQDFVTSQRKAAWGLRLVLLGVFMGLLTTSAIVQATSPPAEMTASVASKTAPSDTATKRPLTTVQKKTEATQVSAPTKSAAPKPKTKPSPVAGAVTGTVTRRRAGASCGLALIGQQAPGPVGHCTVLEIGDSLGNDLGWGLLRHVGKGSGLRLVQLDKSATGLAKPSYYDWPQHLAEDLQKYHPQLVLISMGGNDVQGIWVHGSALRFASAAWRRVYLQRARQLVQEASASGAYTLWVGMPIMRPSYYSHGMQILNALARESVLAEPNATFVSTWSLFANPKGDFQSSARVDGRPVALRSRDGIHYSYTGEDVLATYVIAEMARIYHVQLVPTRPEKITSWR